MREMLLKKAHTGMLLKMAGTTKDGSNDSHQGHMREMLLKKDICERCS